ncbi:TPA: AbgT family antimetabolite efflux transporter MtrF [Neisseria meningitidis]|uniref:AbgT family antimetabolite efflux transporter MtrF n=1 Tax=Neisseria meningitidis TaxID=487 RepID=UPI0009C308AB|nr:AbgT family antimetabolite efflux transporter MtrF [Neisseria meningitidis]ARC06244.1 aminobenzoyl-glutamate transporter [Neisseria meningitidis]QPR91309.1 AbgT family antimetabolite efflux transporter MtrF [Neisseria meningitidis]UON17908.1 AbgT family antimetabolite efflux transporter MtrF [Neisseria meningitidis]VEJ36597.1 antibiotic resistance efflux pump component [Neisseria meningitidis]
MSQTDTQRDGRFLRTVEWLGNMLPHPVTLFIIFIVLLLIASAAGAYFGLSVPDPRPVGAKGRADDGLIHVVSLLDADGLIKILTHTVKNFTGFAPLGTVLVSLLGVGIAEKSGLISALMRLLLTKSPRKLTTFMVVFTGILSNTASELGYVVLIPLSAIIFHSLGRHPLAGLAAAFAGVSGGYSANLFLGTIDSLLAGITQQAAQIIHPDYVVGPEANWFFMVASTFVIALIGYFVTEKIVEPQLGPYQSDLSQEEKDIRHSNEITPLEYKGLIWAGVVFVALSALLAWSIVPADGILRHPETGLVSGSPFLKSIVVFIFLLFALPGIVYGRVTRSLRGEQEVVNAMAESMSTLGLYLVIIFFAAQFVAFFNWTNIGQYIAVKGATFLKEVGLGGSVLFIGFILICAFINLMIGSASAQWAVTAPIFVPMLMLAGYAPEVIQAAYRIGDSVTNIITPMMSYFGLIMATVIKYKKDAGVGTLISMMLPYSAFFLIAWIALFCIWVFVLGLPVGPGAPTLYPAP